MKFTFFFYKMTISKTSCTFIRRVQVKHLVPRKDGVDQAASRCTSIHFTFHDPFQWTKLSSLWNGLASENTKL